MLQLAPTQPLDSTRRPVALRMRPDLIFQERRVGSKKYYVIKDPIRLVHHQLWEEEFALLQMLDGQRSLAEMKEAFVSKFPGTRLDARLLQVLHGQFHQNGLVLSEHIGQSDELLRKHEHFRSQELWRRIGGWMSIRFRGFNPDGLLEYLEKKAGWFFRLPILAAIIGFLLFTLVHFWSHVASLPSFDEYATVQSLVLLYLAFSGLKILHEFGHGLACKHFGGECNEMGVMLLIFTPCLYCDVTDAWMVEGKWKRVMIAASGILFELVAASVCMWIYWITNPGLIHSLCFQVALVGSVGTLLFNGNPLLKYDGYFVVADLLDRPNLSFQAQRVLWNGFSRVYSRRTPNSPADYSGRSDGVLWIYGVLANAYRFALSFVVLFVVFKIFQILRLELVGAFLAGSVLVGWLGWISKGTGTWISAQGGLRNVRKGRVSLTLLVAILLISAVIWLPLPCRLHAFAFVESRGARTVSVLVDGKLQHCQTEGAIVRAGDELASFVSEDLELSLVSRKGELARQRARLTGLESQRGTDPLVAAMMPSVQEAIHGLEIEIQRLESDKDQLTLRAPVDGVVLAPSTTQPVVSPDEIQKWSGLPMDAENLGCVLRRGTTFCEVGDPQNLQGTLYLSQSQVELLERGQVAFLKSKAAPSITFRGTISEVGSSATLELPTEVARAGIFPSLVNRNGQYESTEPVFLAKVEIAPESLRECKSMPLHHSIAKASIQIQSQSLGQRIARFVYSTFAIDPTVKGRLSQ